MRRLVSSGSWKTVLLGTIALTGLVFAWSAERRSPERANRLYRSGALQEAASIYADRLDRDPASPQLRYNFGTALLGLRNEKASAELSRASTAADGEVQARALYNLGLWDLTEAVNADGIDVAKAHALSAVATNKSVLRLQPGRADAGWNLAIALRLLASIDAEIHSGAPMSTKGVVGRDRALVAADDARDVNHEEKRQEGPRTAEGETAARAGEIASLSVSEASEIIGTGHRDPTMMVRKLMAFEGRAVRLRAVTRTRDH